MRRVSVVFVRAVLAYVERYGHPTAELLAVSGISADDLKMSEHRVDLETFASLFLKARALTGKDAMGLHLTRRVPEAAFEVMAHLILHAPSLRHAFQACVQYQPIMLDGAEVQLRESADVFRAEFHFPRLEPQFDQLFSEFAMSGVFRMVQAFAGPTIAPLSIGFAHPRPKHAAEYLRIFRIAPKFSQVLVTIELPRDCLDRPFLHGQPELYSLMRKEAEARLARIARPEGESERLKRYLASRSPVRVPTMTVAARDLGISERTLRRRLVNEGVTFRELVNGALFAEAKRLLREPNATIQSAAGQLGFADATTFHRAFKRWCGVTPLEYQRRSSAHGEVEGQ